MFQFDWFFSSWDVDDHVPYDEDEAYIPVSSMNQQLLDKAQYMGMYYNVLHIRISIRNPILHYKNIGYRVRISYRHSPGM